MPWGAGQLTLPFPLDINDQAYPGYLTAVVVRPHEHDGDVFEVRKGLFALCDPAVTHYLLPPSKARTDTNTVLGGLGYRLQYSRQAGRSYEFSASAHGVRPALWLLVEVPPPRAVHELDAAGRWQLLDSTALQYDAHRRKLTQLSAQPHLGSAFRVEW